MTDRPNLKTKIVLDVPTLRQIVHQYLEANGYQVEQGGFEHEKTNNGYRVSGYEATVKMPLPNPTWPAVGQMMLPAGGDDVS